MSSRESKLATIERGLDPDKAFDIMCDELEASIKDIPGYGAITTKPEVLERILSLVAKDKLSSPFLTELAEKTRQWNNPNSSPLTWLLEDLHGSDERFGNYWTPRKVKSEIVRLHNYPEATMLSYDTLKKGIRYFRERGQIPDYLYGMASARIPEGLDDG